MIYHGEDLGDFYLVSNNGEIKGIKSGKTRSKNINKEGYYFVCVSLASRNSKSYIKVHRAVAETFIKNPNNLPVINHIDGNKLNNDVSNLEWCTHKQNTQHAISMKLMNPGDYRKQPIVQMDTKTNRIIHIYDSIAEALEVFGKGKNTGTISACARGKTNTAYGFKWMYLEDYINNVGYKIIK